MVTTTHREQGFTGKKVVSPVLLKLLKKWLARKKMQHQTELETILNMLPEIGLLVKKSWLQSANQTGTSRINLFLKLALQQLFVLPAEAPEQFFPEK